MAGESSPSIEIRLYVADEFERLVSRAGDAVVGVNLLPSGDARRLRIEDEPVEIKNEGTHHNWEARSREGVGQRGRVGDMPVLSLALHSGASGVARKFETP